MDKDFRRYTYKGPIVNGFGGIVADKWTGETVAVSEKKARSNLTYQAKRELGLEPYGRITLPGKVNEIL